MQITIPAATVGIPPAFFEWIKANGPYPEGISAANPFYITDEQIAGTTVFGTGFEYPIVVPLDDYLAGWLLETFGPATEPTTNLDDMAALVVQLEEARQAAKNATEKANEARDQILARLRMEGSSIGTVAGRPAVEVKVVESKRLDTARLRREQPDIADIYTSVSTSERLEIL